MSQIDMIRGMGFNPEKLGAKRINGELYKPDADPKNTGSCVVCGKPGVWICGAGSILCAKHQACY